MGGSESTQARSADPACDVLDAAPKRGGEVRSDQMMPPNGIAWAKLGHGSLVSNRKGDGRAAVNQKRAVAQISDP